MSRSTAAVLLLLLGAAACSPGAGQQRVGPGCAGDQAPLCHEAPDHATGGGQGNGGGMGHGGGMM